MARDIFHGVHYYFSTTLSANERDPLTELLDEEGAIAVPLDDITLTHFISNSLPSDKTLEPLPDGTSAHIVTPTWVHRSIALGSQQPPEYYSADPLHLFSGITATATDLSSADNELLSAAITALGGQWRSALTRDVTHLFALAPGSAKYETAMHFKDETGMHVLVPHWFDDTVRLGARGLPMDGYEWPEPRVLKFAHDPASAFPSKPRDRASQKISRARRILYDTALASSTEYKLKRAPPRDVWKGRKILLSASLDLNESQRDAHESDIERGGGVVVKLELLDTGTASELSEEETRKVEDADIFVTRFRSGAAYAKAMRLHKTVGTLSWLWYVRASGTLSNPTSQLLHYPVPKKLIDKFSNHIITITNYTGRDREYLKKLISAMGAQFTPDMTSNNTVVIAAYIRGDKTTKAISWSIPIVNHTWLEDCFAHWRALTPACAKYTQFPPGVDFSAVLAERGLARAVCDPDPAELAALEAEDEEEDAVEEELGQGRGAGLTRQNTANSARDAREVEDAVMLEEEQVGDVSIGAYMDVDMHLDEDPPRRAKPRSTARSAEERKRDVPTSSPKTGRPKRGRPSADAGADEEPVVSPRTGRQSDAAVQRAKKATGSKAKQPTIDSETESEDDEVENDPQPLRRPRTITTSTTTIPETRMPSSPSKPSSSPLKSPLRSNRTVRPQVSVELPSVAAVYKSPPKQKPKSAAKPPTPKPVARTDSVRVTAAEAASSSSARKRGRPSDSPSKRPKPPSPSPPPSLSHSPSPPPKPVRRKRAEVVIDTPSAGPSCSEEIPRSLLTRTPSKRSAATRATQKLRDEIMPDVVNFQKELKRGSVRAIGEGEREKEREANAKGKKRASLGGEGPQQEEGEPEKKKRRTSMGKLATAADVLPEGQGTKRGKARDDVVRRRSVADDAATDIRDDAPRRRSTKNAKIMTTMVQLSSEITKVISSSIPRFGTAPNTFMQALIGLGVKVLSDASEASECTHLVANNFVRTEKFLCALAKTPYIVSDRWLTSSIAQKRLLPEEDFALTDRESEKKFGVTIEDVLERARANKGKLFTGMTFYITPKVPAKLSMLKNVIATFGGQVLTQTPTVRILHANENRYVISCQADKSIWQPLARQGYPIYSEELILNGALKQEIEWDKDEHRVDL
ncbi:hypothetical protein CERSUDRAFT_89793 [Gelatoporia subvermispora B]|uniref:BRCT domain-containing protein n=1 Tax=Ceriporiopsis subvermispora (strain B) TaxID=914234 RepID=M2QVS4_CERS8|nr:hypothetical protein CERSUDRAFT_89793 [Gelatoporia subvermispora B]